MSERVVLVWALVLVAGLFGTACDNLPSSTGFRLDDGGRVEVFPIQCIAGTSVTGLRIADTGERHVSSIDRSKEVTVWEVRAQGETAFDGPFTVGVVPAGFDQTTPLTGSLSDAFLRAYVTKRRPDGKAYETRELFRLSDLSMDGIKVESRLLNDSEFETYAAKTAC